MDEVALSEYAYTMSLMTKARQISGGFYYAPDGVPIYLPKNPKRDLLVEVVQQLLEEDSARQIIVWHAFRVEKDIIWQALAHAGISTCSGPSTEALKTFVNRDATVITMPCSVSEGFNELVGADVNIFYSNNYSIDLREQAEARIARPGQVNPIVTHIDLCSPRQVDVDIVAALQNKSLTPERLDTIVRRRK
jgi:hypothetical protein